MTVRTLSFCLISYSQRVQTLQLKLVLVYMRKHFYNTSLLLTFSSISSVRPVTAPVQLRFTSPCLLEKHCIGTVVIIRESVQQRIYFRIIFTLKFESKLLCTDSFEYTSFALLSRSLKIGVNFAFFVLTPKSAVKASRRRTRRIFSTITISLNIMIKIFMHIILQQIHCSQLCKLLQIEVVMRVCTRLQFIIVHILDENSKALII